jgi:hypothetical protein
MVTRRGAIYKKSIVEQVSTCLYIIYDSAATLRRLAASWHKEKE